MWVQTGRRAGGQLSQRLTPPPLHFHFHPHTLIYTRSWLLISRGGSSLPVSKACVSFVFLWLIYIHGVITYMVFQKCGLKMVTYSRAICEPRSTRVSLCNLCVFAPRLQLEGKGRDEGIWCRWQSGSAQTWRGEGTERPAVHHQVHFAKTLSHSQPWGT